MGIVLVGKNSKVGTGNELRRPLIQTRGSFSLVALNDLNLEERHPRRMDRNNAIRQVNKWLQHM